MAWASCRAMGIWLWNGHLAVERASCLFHFSGAQDAHATHINPLIQKRCSAVLGVSPMSDCIKTMPYPQERSGGLLKSQD
ncbi:MULTISPECIES: hypothetical protein [unclassified Moorena]|uniref:hypothetical protein n=1 Tax=unclassified Moorena TaxID=2683338 RepID=UPI0013B6C4EB|nr:MULTISPECIES: hypothetical protein [unclassified Moorena]NEQ14509.1 hypothetical protein [Moorena sp. SIO3E2]NEP36790.1 hypothetical protein [Moorena sp. SIO3B2]NEP69881.1 hypothetical protein [Moorena sp. SIO3A5]NEQ11528.1 hypothetical protein [Moorena sp. SIO4E2]NER91925.1 hypothetical protein [Moorena sp. SIO3A2]